MGEQVLCNCDVRHRKTKRSYQHKIYVIYAKTYFHIDKYWPNKKKAYTTFDIMFSIELVSDDPANKLLINLSAL